MFELLLTDSSISKEVLIDKTSKMKTHKLKGLFFSLILITLYSCSGDRPCYSACGPYGECVDGTCECDEGWAGEDCTIRQTHFELQERLNNGESPYEIYLSNKSLLSDLYGRVYEGGLIFYLDTLTGTGMVAAENDQAGGRLWGCEDLDITGANSKEVGAGKENTMSIVMNCPGDWLAAGICDALEENGYSDWFLPSLRELELMEENLFNSYYGNFDYVSPAFQPCPVDRRCDPYWSSTQRDSISSFYLLFGSSINSDFYSQKEIGGYNVRAARAF